MREPFRRTIEVGDGLSEVGRVQAEVEALWRGLELPEDIENTVCLALEEVLSNVLRHGREGSGPKEIRVTFAADAEGVGFEVSDRTAPFDPTAVPDPDVGAPLGERQAGGLGIFLVRKLADELSYERRGERNVLRFRKRFGGE